MLHLFVVRVKEREVFETVGSPPQAMRQGQVSKGATVLSVTSCCIPTATATVRKLALVREAPLGTNSLGYYLFVPRMKFIPTTDSSNRD